MSSDIHVHITLHLTLIIFSDNNKEEGSHGSPQREEGESPDDAEGGGTAQPAPVAEEESSEDEMVFEAYVSPLDVSADQEDSALGDEDVKVCIIIASI